MHVPVVEIIEVVMRLRNNKVFLHVSHILILSLVALSAIGHAGEWSKGLDPSMPGCTLPKWECYQGPPLTMLESISQLGMPTHLLLLPMIDLFSGFLLFFRPARTYLILWGFSFTAFFIQMLGSNAVPYTNVMSGSGYWLSEIALLLLFLLNMPLAFVEQMDLYPNWNYRKYLPPFVAS